MKDEKQLGTECFQNFVKAHPELTSMAGNIINQLQTGEKITYSRIAIDFAIGFMMEQWQLEKKKK